MKLVASMLQSIWFCNALFAIEILNNGTPIHRRVYSLPMDIDLIFGPHIETRAYRCLLINMCRVSM